KHYPSQLSGGQQQRVAVARALSGDPLILLADEPTGNLDSANGEAVMSLLRELHAAGSTICMVTHDPRYAEFADRTVRLFDGRIVEENIESAKNLACGKPLAYAPGSDRSGARGTLRVGSGLSRYERVVSSARTGAA